MGVIRVAASPSGSGLCLIELSTDATQSDPSDITMRATGAETNTNKVVARNLGTGNPEHITTTAVPAGDYTDSIFVGLTDIGFTIEYRRRLARHSAIGNVTVWNTDTRTA